MNNTSQLKQRVLDAEAELAYYKSLVGAFFTGIVPENPALQHFIFAQWGRKRLAEQTNLPAILKVTGP